MGAHHQHDERHDHDQKQGTLRHSFLLVTQFPVTRKEKRENASERVSRSVLTDRRGRFSFGSGTQMHGKRPPACIPSKRLELSILICMSSEFTVYNLLRVKVSEPDVHVK